MRFARSAVALALVALAGACGSAEPRRGDDLLESHTVRLDDNGTTVRLQVGDGLRVDLSAEAELRWEIVSYPKELLRLQEGGTQTGLFEFVSVAAGQGRIDAVSHCPPPRPGGDASPGADCPPGGADDGQDPTATREPLPVFAVMIEVVQGP